ncbi:hypothetical protein CWE08_06905 [Aliidiomarina iranensis]|uniref:DUF306 domain-containing protein n=1 Tax=Aliidiomarina iranensis TaxID=1434071 RepID=A0A432VWF3_9GAMM|nr:META domain-containing protein [Aliidiomarina iranensis]RUO20824.1 hypothetical protein CWE08_06905 [Aliidiomarina iranensis]
MANTPGNVHNHNLKALFLLASGLALSACSSPTETTACCVEDTGEILLEARGNEPFWNLILYETRVELNRMSEEQLQFAWQERAVGEYNLFSENAGEIVGTAKIIEEVCRDTMTGMPYPKRAEVTVGEQQLSGCAGSPIELLAGPEWRITHVQGEAIAESVAVSINFGENGEVYGNSGCNRFVGEYVLTGENFQLHQLASTRMACSEIQMATENQVLEALSDVVRFDIETDNVLELITSSGTRLRSVLN